MEQSKRMKIAYLINCRPIQVVVTLHDLDTLTPNHFLISDQAGAVFPPDLSNSDTLKLPKCLEHQLMVQKHLWKRFHEEIIPMMGPRKKWSLERKNLAENDVVMEIDDDLPRGIWRLLRVTKILPSSDGLVRSVEVVNSIGKIYQRPISRLMPIARA